VNFMAYKRWFIGAFVVAVISFLVWLLGPLLSIGETHPIESNGTRLTIIVFVILLWLAFEGGRILRRRRRNRLMIKELTASGGDGSISREESEQLSQRFSAALETLKSKQLGGKSSSKLLYQLPWYMFIGAPGSGKTTALVNSGLRFPLATPGATASALGGIGGTRNCDWWFTDDAVLIDTAGRYTTQDSNASVDQSAWNTFLQLLKRFRPRQPINGVFITLSVSDLVTFKSEERLHYAHVVRQRVEDLQKDLGLQFPVYILVTKTDLVAGFNEFFATYDAEQRAQVWGITFSYDVKTRQASNARESFDQGFPGLVRKLNDVLLTRLQEERDSERRAGMYPFPQQFAALGPLISEFLDAAFGDSKYSAQALVRGIYFTSGTQQGAPIDRLLGSLAKSLELKSGSGRRASPMPGAAKSYFINRLMKEVIFPEAGLAGHSEKRETLLRRLSWALVASVMVVGSGLIAAWTVSYFSNKQGLERANQAAQSSRTALSAVGAPAATDLPVLVEALNTMRRVAPSVNEPVDSPPWSMGWGLYQGAKIEDQVGERYRFALRQGLLPRIALQLEAIMAAPQQKPEAVYAALKAYLMMYDANRLDEGVLIATVVDLWFGKGIDKDSIVAGRDHLTELVRTKDLQVARFHPMNDAMVAFARERVASASLIDRAYGLLRLSSGDPTKGLRLSEVVGPAGVGVFERKSGASLSDPIDYMFTRNGYRNSVKPKIKQLVAQLSAEEAWVLGNKASGVGNANTRDVEDTVLRKFLADYQTTWEGVLKDIRVRKIDSIRTAMNVAQVLAQADSPLKRLVVAVAEQTQLSTADLTSNAVATAEDNAKRKLAAAATSATTGLFGSGATQVVGAALQTSDPVKAQEQALEDQFAPLRRLAGEGKGGEIDAAVALINEIFNELVAIQQKLSGPGIKEMPAALGRAKAQADRFGMPVSGAIKDLVESAEQVASGGVKQEVKAGVGGASSMCKRAIPGNYPFTRSSAQDVGVQDFVNVFKSGGDLDSFFNANLSQYVDKSAGGWRLKASGEGAPPVSVATLRQFQNADAIRTAFLSGGVTPAVTVDVAVISGDAEVTLEYDGAAHKMRVGSGGARIVWPARPGIKLSMQGQPVASAEGAWALFRIVDKGTVDPSSTGDRVRVSYSGPGGARVSLELRTGSAAFNPFRLREMAMFACPQE